jgi:MurNAc alpha-1-phosphate uridylyltransferase
MRGKIKRAMILAAGYGTRLKPLTDRMPKPLIPVAGKPMIEYALDKLREHGIQEVVINVSHLKDQLVAYLAWYPGLVIKISEEAEPLETGGGLKKALPLLGNDPFIYVNSDIIWLDASPCSSRREEAPRSNPLKSEPPNVGCHTVEGEGTQFLGTSLERLTHYWDDARMDILLLIQPRAKAIGYDKGEDHLFIRPEHTFEWNDQEAPYIIASVGILHPRILREAPDGKFSAKKLWLKALAENRLFCVPHRGPWFQTGTPADLGKAEGYLRKG